MLAAIGVMAVSGSTAQAKWLILENTNSISSITLNGAVNAGEILVSGLLALYCTGGPAIATISTKEESEKLEISSTAILNNCIVKDGLGKENGNCTVNSVGEPAKRIEVESAGVATMPNALAVSFLLFGSELVKIEINGALCPLDEFDASVNGAASLTMPEGVDKRTTHVFHLDEERDKEGNSLLFYEENEADLNSAAAPVVLVSALAVSGNAWALALVGL